MTLDQQNVGFRESLKSGLQRRVLDSGRNANELIREAASDNSAYLRYLARCPETIETGCQRLLKCRRYSLNAVPPAALQQKSRYFFDKQWHATGAFSYASDDFRRKSVARR